MFINDRQVPVDAGVYDVRGRLVRQMANITVSGEARVEWDGRDEFGNPVASGTYYLAVRSRTGTHTSKVILVR